MKKKILEWISTGKINDSKQVRELAPILSTAEAMKVLDRSGFKDANAVFSYESITWHHQGTTDEAHDLTFPIWLAFALTDP